MPLSCMLYHAFLGKFFAFLHGKSCFPGYISCFPVWYILLSCMILIYHDFLDKYPAFLHDIFSFPAWNILLSCMLYPAFLDKYPSFLQGWYACIQLSCMIYVQCISGMGKLCKNQFLFYISKCTYFLVAYITSNTALYTSCCDIIRLERLYRACFSSCMLCPFSKGV